MPLSIREHRSATTGSLLQLTYRTMAGSNSMSGYSVVEAADMDAALEMAKACPFLETGGCIEVAQVMVMGGGRQ